MLRWSALVACWSALIAVHACTRVEVADAPGVSIIQAGFAGDAAGGEDGLAGFGGEGGGGPPLSSGGAPPELSLALWPTFPVPANADPTVEAVLAAASALSLGSKSLPLVERWDTLSGATGSPRAVAWRRLDALVEPYRAAGRPVALCIGIVDRTLDARPFEGELDSPVARSAIERTIDEAFAHFAGDLSELCFGYELDRFLPTLAASERASLLAFVEHAVGYASAHPERRPEVTRIGVALSLDALVSGSPSGVEDFLRLGDEAMAVYDPLTAELEARAPGSVAEDLGAALARVEGPLGAGVAPRTLALFEVGYPSASEVGSSQQRQREFFEALFAELDALRGRVVFAGVHGLSDRSPADCELEAPAFGDADEARAARAASRCSMGLRTEGGQAKLAWPALISAISRYR